MSKTHEISQMPAEIVIDNDLSLRQLVPDDAEAMFQIIQDAPEIKQNVTWSASVHSLDDARRGIEQLLRENKSPYVLQEGEETIGFAGIWYSKDNEHELGFSYFLAKDKRGHGYITRAIKALMQATKENLSINTFAVNIIDANEPSKAIAAKLGFKATDILLEDKALPALIRRYERPA
jgi:RimJ/RimL family protein N-acetyltransferase